MQNMAADCLQLLDPDDEEGGLSEGGHQWLAREIPNPPWAAFTSGPGLPGLYGDKDPDDEEESLSEVGHWWLAREIPNPPGDMFTGGPGLSGLYGDKDSRLQEGSGALDHILRAGILKDQLALLRPVYVISNCIPTEPQVTAKRWDSVEKKKVDVPMPAIIAAYNKGIGGVDLLDQMVACYRPHIRKRKWWWCFHTWGLAATSVNAWRLQMAATNTKVDYLTFLRGLVIRLLKTFGETRKRPGRTLTARGTAGDTQRTDGLNHWIVSRDWSATCVITGQYSVIDYN